jgi:hypothetical protein
MEVKCRVKDLRKKYQNMPGIVDKVKNLNIEHQSIFQRSLSNLLDGIIK